MDKLLLKLLITFYLIFLLTPVICDDDISHIYLKL